MKRKLSFNEKDRPVIWISEKGVDTNYDFQILSKSVWIIYF